MKTIWITGASSGIGEALCLAYAQTGHTLILSGRNAQKLEEVAGRIRVAGAEAIVLPLDMSDVDTFDAAIQELKTRVAGIDILINNAGMSQRSRILETNLSTDRRIFEVNYFGTIELSRKVLGWMIEKGGGHMVAMSSISGKFGFPLRSTYSASKHALMGFFETMDLEYAHNGISVTIICPGRVNTPISLNALKGDGSKHEAMDQGLKAGMDVDVCARKIRRAIDHKKYIYYVGGKELIMVWLFKFFPSIFRKIARKVNPT